MLNTSGPQVPSARSSAKSRAHKDKEAECASMSTAVSANVVVAHGKTHTECCANVVVAHGKTHTESREQCVWPCPRSCGPP
jgi:hypothetical protein